MKAAICIPGFIRTWEHTKLSFIKNLVQDIDCDIFVHTYKQNYYEYSSYKKDVVYSDDQIYSMFEGMNVKKIVIEDRDLVRSSIEEQSKKYENVQNYKIRIKESAEETENYVNLGIRIYDQLRKMHLCNQLRKEYQQDSGENYDFVVKSRFDVLYIDKVNWRSFVDDQMVYNGDGGCGGFPDDLVGIGKEKPMNAYMDRFLNLDKMCFEKVRKNDFVHKNWYNHHGENIFPLHEFCAHDTLLRNLVYNGCDITSGGFRNRLLRNEGQILNWDHCVINGVHIPPSKMTNGVIMSGDNSSFDISSFNDSLMRESR